MGIALTFLSLFWSHLTSSSYKIAGLPSRVAGGCIFDRNCPSSPACIFKWPYLPQYLVRFYGTFGCFVGLFALLCFVLTHAIRHDVFRYSGWSPALTCSSVCMSILSMLASSLERVSEYTLASFVLDLFHVFLLTHFVAHTLG